MVEKTIISYGIISLAIDLIISSKIRKEILKILIENEDISISNIKNIFEKRGEKYNYKTFWQHIQTLEKSGMITLKKDEHKAGKPTIIRYNKEFYPKELLKLRL